MKFISLKNLSQAGLACAALGFLAAPLSAVTIFIDDPNAVASAKWDTWSWGEKTLGASGSQGAAQDVTSAGGFDLVSSEVTTEILWPISPFAGGLVDGGDSFYVFDGAFEWSVNATFNTNVDFVRVSYGLRISDQGTEAFPNGPSLNIEATGIGSGTYNDLDNGILIFFTDFALTNPSNAFTATFADNAFGNHQSHRSVDAIQIEAFSGTPPSVIPEPSTYALGAGIGMLGLVCLRRRFRRG